MVRKLTRTIVKIGLVAAIAATSFLPSLAVAQNAQFGPKPAQIDRNGVIILVRTSLIALDQANKTGNYTVLRDLSAPSLQQAMTAAALGEYFAPQRKQNLDLSGVAALDPQLTLLPQIEANGMMHMAGFFPSVPNQIRFELMYQPVSRQWKLSGLSVSIDPSGPMAPPTAADMPPPAPTAPAARSSSRKTTP